MGTLSPARRAGRIRDYAVLGQLAGWGAALGLLVLAERRLRHGGSLGERDLARVRRLAWLALLPTAFGRLGRAGGRGLDRGRQRRRSQARLEADFAGMVAHDFRDPLAALLALVGSLRRRAGEDSVRIGLADLQRLERLGWRLDRLVGDLFDAMVLASDGLELRREPVELAQLVPALLERLSPMLSGHRVSFAVEGEPPAVFADRARAEQVLGNLLENAAKFSAVSTPIELTLRAARGGAVLSVRDRGVGIAPEELSRLFDRGYQARRAREKKTGLGLGLHLTKGLVEAHGGWIGVESEPGRGSTFSVFLPAAARVGVEAPGGP